MIKNEREIFQSNVKRVWWFRNAVCTKVQVHIADEVQLTKESKNLILRDVRLKNRLKLLDRVGGVEIAAETL